MKMGLYEKKKVFNGESRIPDLRRQGQRVIYCATTTNIDFGR